MESFFEFIFGNIVLVVIIIGALINFLNKGKEDDAEEEAPKKPVPPPQVKRESVPPPRAERSVQEGYPQETLADYQEQQQAQYERLKAQYHAASLEKDTPKEVQERLKKQANPILNNEINDGIHIGLEQKLTPKGLMESVIMAEVLGPPRAVNPYENIIMKRKRRR